MIERTPGLLRMFGFPNFRRWYQWLDCEARLLYRSEGCWEYGDDPEDFE